MPLPAPGSTIGLISPAFSVPESTCRAAESWVQDWGFIPRLFPVSGYDDIYAGPTQNRLDALLSALYDDEVSGLWALRGGAGTRQLIPFLKNLAPPPTQKWIVGFSDITALLIHAQQTWGWLVFHGPNLSRLLKNDYTPDTVQMLKDVLKGNRRRLTYSLTPLNSAARAATHLNAPITGGNLSVIQYGIGTSSQALTKGHFLFLEDVNERAYRLDQILEHCAQAGLFQGVRGVLLGDFSFDLGPDDGGQEPMVQGVLHKFASALPHPVYKISGIGHGPRNGVLPFGIDVVIVSNGPHFSLEINL